jgi:diketogulonate reductase-like aldo/keto reductase
LPGLIYDLAKKYTVTPAQILIKWQVQRGWICVTTSMKEERRKTQIQIMGWEMDESDLQKIEVAGREMSYRFFAWGDISAGFGNNGIKYVSVL